MTGRPAQGASAAGGRNSVVKIIAALGVVLVVQSVFALCLVSAQQLLVPRNMPFGVTGPPSPVVAAVASQAGLDLTSYPNTSAVMDAVDQGELYGAYVSNGSSDTLVVVPAKSFFAQTELEPAFLEAAHKLGRPVTVQTVKPLASSDPVGAVTSLLLIPLLIGGYLAAVLVFKAAHGVAAAPWRAAVLVGYALVGAVLTSLIAGLGIGAYSSSHFWPLLPCFWLITSAVALAAAGVQALVGRMGTLIVALLFIVIGGPPAGGLGTYLLPVYWRNIGVIFPAQSAVTLINRVLYFGGNGISTPLTVLFLYAFAGMAVIAWFGRIRPGRTAAGTGGPEARASDSRHPVTSAPQRRRAVTGMLVALGICAVMQCLFSTTYMIASHAPKATDLPFGTVGSSPVLAAAEKNISLKVTQYADEAAVKSAIDHARIYGALVTSGGQNTLIVAPSMSDLAPLDLAVRFEEAAKSTGQKLAVQQYAPLPLVPKDPFGLVQGLMLVPLLIGGYMSSTLLMTATGKAAGRWRAAQLAGFAVVSGLVVDLIVCYWLEGFPSSRFWITWPVCSLIVAVVAFVAAILQKLLGPIGTLLTVVVIMLFGNPSSGGANGVPYLPAFWRDIGPYLPPRNGYLLLHRTIYFDGHGTSQSLINLLIYLAVAAAVLIVLDLRHTEAKVPTDATEAAAVSVPIGAVP
ncbi:ABC transporter permease [Streptomyces aureus]|uniref:ABC transporter permease n=1 Tax=Streptomyces aureus TaxID=193461 RepID=UPI00131C7AB1|nr:ABC transporter permease [Streptomyces aureus]